jgi:hypothetical protein
MKLLYLLILTALTSVLFTGCEIDEHHHHGYYGAGPVYEYGHDWDRGWDHYDRDWDHR